MPLPRILKSILRHLLNCKPHCNNWANILKTTNHINCFISFWKLSLIIYIRNAPSFNGIRPSGLKYEKAKEWRIPCVNAQWLCDILLGNFEGLRQIQHSRYSQFNLPEALAPNPHLVHNLLSKLYSKQQSNFELLRCYSCKISKLLKR